MNNKADYLKAITVEDKNDNDVELMIYQDRSSNGVFAVDASFIIDLDIHRIISPFNKSQVLTLVGD